MNRVFLLFSEDSRSLSRQKRAKSTIGGALTGIEIGKRHFSKTRTQSTFLCAEIGIETKNQLFSLESYLASSMKKGKYQKTFLFQVTLEKTVQMTFSKTGLKNYIVFLCQGLKNYSAVPF